MPREGETMPEAMWLESRKALSKGRVHITATQASADLAFQWEVALLSPLLG